MQFWLYAKYRISWSNIGLLFTPSKRTNIEKLDLLKALPKNGLKISLKKRKLFTKLQYMWNTFFIKKEGFAENHWQVPDNKGRFHLYSDTSKFARWSVFINSKAKIIGYPIKECLMQQRTIQLQN